MNEELLRSRIRDVPDFPRAGVLFKDISPLLGDPVAFRAAVAALINHSEQLGVQKVVGIEARGFLLAAPVAFELGVGMVPVRKPGKLPGAVHETSYDLEYGSNVLQLQRDALAAEERVLVVDDVLATGGTASAAVRLVQRAGAQVVGISVLLELSQLGGRVLLEELHPAVGVHALLTS